MIRTSQARPVRIYISLAATGLASLLGCGGSPSSPGEGGAANTEETSDSSGGTSTNTGGASNSNASGGSGGLTSESSSSPEAPALGTGGSESSGGAGAAETGGSGGVTETGGTGGEVTTPVPGTSCSASQYLDEGQCVNLSSCDAGTYVSQQPTAKTDRKCSACAIGSYSTTSNVSACTAWSECSNSILTAGSKTTDVVCNPSAIALSAGYGHTCAVLDSGRVNCWGANSFGQLGRASTEYQTSKTPLRVQNADGSAFRGVQQLAAGGWHTCALLNTGEVWCWGQNSSGQLGGDSASSFIASPVQVIGLDKRATSIASGYSFSCALLTDGSVKCWGSNTNGELGLDPAQTTKSRTAQSVTGLGSGVSAISAGYTHSCALMTDGAVKCWGSNFAGELGEKPYTPESRFTPTRVGNFTASSISSGYRLNCAQVGAGLHCWGSNDKLQLGASPDTSAAYKQADLSFTSGLQILSQDSGGQGHSCVLLSNGSVWCWGRNNAGQLGYSTPTTTVPYAESPTPSPTPGEVYGISGTVRSLKLGSQSTWVLLDTGAIQSWGSDNVSGTSSSPTTLGNFQP